MIITGMFLAKGMSGFNLAFRQKQVWAGVEKNVLNPTTFHDPFKNGQL
jgi:hypothetical protein